MFMAKKLIGLWAKKIGVELRSIKLPNWNAKVNHLGLLFKTINKALRTLTFP